MCTNTQAYKYTSIQIHKYITSKMHQVCKYKYTNMHKYTNTKVQQFQLMTQTKLFEMKNSTSRFDISQQYCSHFSEVTFVMCLYKLLCVSKSCNFSKLLITGLQTLESYILLALTPESRFHQTLLLSVLTKIQ